MISDYLLWQKEQGGGFPAILNDTNVVFIYYSTFSTGSCKVTGDFTGWSEAGISMQRLDPTTDFFYKELSFEPRARLDYKFIIDGNWQLDGRNPNKVEGGFGYNSELAMPQFIQPTEIIYHPDIPHGNLTILPSPWDSPKVQVYLPPNYNPNKTYPTFYTSDGSEYIRLGSAVKILDNLIDDKRIEPVIGVFIDPLGDRITWYQCNPDYITYLDGLVIYIDSMYSTNNSAYSRLHFGDSMGGLVSVYVGLERFDKFKLIGSHSGAFWYDGNYEIIKKFQNVSSSIDLKVWFSAGTYESTIHMDTQTMVNASQSHGWTTEFISLFEGHSWGSWRHSLDNLLEFFFPYRPEVISSDTASIMSTITSNNEVTDFYLFPSIFGFIWFWFMNRRRRIK